MDLQTLVLDGGTGHLLKSKGVEALCEGAGLGYDELFAAGSLANALAPQLVRDVHDEYIAAGAAVITSNTFGCTRWSLGKIGRADQAVELAVAGAKIAREAADAAGRGVTVAGSLPPLEESYQVHSPAKCAAAADEYRALAAALAPHVDLFICETMANAAQARVACESAAKEGGGKPLWVSFTLEDSSRAVLRSGEPLIAAATSISDVPGLQAILINCCAPAAATAGLKALKGAPFLRERRLQVGVYANGFRTTTSEWLISQEENKGDDDTCLLQLPEEEYDSDGIIKPEAYRRHAREWVAEGASIVGGCCGVGPAHIALLRDLDGGGEGS